MLQLEVLEDRTAPAVVSYVVPTGTVGNQDFGGSLGMDFNVNQDTRITHLGVFDSGSNGLASPISVRLFNRATQTEITSILNNSGTSGTLLGGSRFYSLATPITLSTGFQGTIVAEGYSTAEPNGNSNGATPTWTTDSGGGLISFVGSGRFGTAGQFPGSSDGGPANRYAAGTFLFTSTTPSTVFVDDNYAGLAANTIVDTDPNTAGVQPGVIGTDAFDTIQGGVNAVATGGTVKVAAGTYPELVSVNKSVTLLGAQAGIDARTRSGTPSTESVVRGSPSTGDQSGSFNITASNVILDGFTVRDQSDSDQFDPLLRNGAIVMGSSTSGVTVRNNIITNNVNGILASSSGASTIERNLFDANNQVLAATGIFSTGSVGLTIDDNEFRNHTQGEPLVLDAVGVNAHTNLTVSDNFIHDNVNGIFALGVNGGVFRGNTITNGGTTTALTFGGASTAIDVLRNDLSGNARGLRIVDFGFLGVTPNSDIEAHFNSFAGNTQYGAGISNEGMGLTDGYTGLLDLTGNWWGNVTGPTSTANPGGSGTVLRNDFGDNIDFQPWLVYGDASASQVGFQLPTSFTVAAQTSTFTTTNNNYRRLVNVVDLLQNGQTATLSGNFNWTETNAAASWALGNDGVNSTNDDYSLFVRNNLNNATITAASLGAARIQGPGDLANVNLEGVFFFDGGDNQNWTLSNLEIFDFDLAIGMFNGAGGTDAFNGTTITNNRIRVPADLNTTAAPIDVNQNIGIHFSFGTNQTISNNQIELVGSGVSNSTGGNFSSSVGMQSNTSGGNVYNGLTITGNVLTITGAQAADPATVLGIWENAHGHTSNITVSNNQVLNQTTGGTPANNLIRAFRVTSHSSATSTVAYTGNTVTGANIGFQWLAAQNFAGNQAVRLWGNTLTNNATGVLVQSGGTANLFQNTITGSGSGGGVHVVTGSLAGSGSVTNAVQENFISGGAGDGILIDATAGVIGPIFNNDLGNNTGLGVNNLTGSLVNASGNWWGTNTAAGVAAEVSANVDYTPWLDAGTDTSTTAGFQGSFATLHVDDSSPQSGAGGRILEGITLAAGASPTVIIEAGTYLESVAANKSGLTLRGATGTATDVVIDPPSGNGITVSANNVTIRDMRITGAATGLVASNVTPLTLSNLLVDGNTAGGTLTNVATVDFTASPNPDTIDVDGDDFSATGVQSIAYTGVTNLTVRGGNGADTFNVTPPATGGTSISIDGGDPTTAPGDVLNYNAQGQTVTQTTSPIMADGLQPVAYTNIETLNILNPGSLTGDVTFTGTPGDDTLIIDATSSDDGTYTLITPDGTTTGPLTNITSLLFNGMGGNDLLRINNPSGGLFAPSGGIFYNGGGQPGDALENLGGSATSGNYTPGPTNDAGTITHVNGALTQTIQFTGLAPATDAVPEDTFTITANDAANTITVDNGTTTGDGLVRVSVDAFEAVEFANKTNVVINAFVTAADAGDTITVNYTDAATGLTTLTVNGGAGNDQARVQATAPGVITNVNTQANDDTININSLAPGVTGDLNAIQGTLNLDAGAGNNFLNISDFGDADGNANVVATSSAITGLAGPTDNVAINYSATGGGFGQINVNLSNLAGDTVAAQSTFAGSETRFFGLGGNDTFNVGGPGNSLDGLGGPLTLDGGAGLGDVANLNDQGDADGNAYAIDADSVDRTGGPSISYNEIETLNVNSGNGADTYNVSSSPTTTYNLDANAPSTGTGDTLNFDAQGLPASNNGSQITQPGRQPVNYADFETVNVSNALLTGDAVLTGTPGNDTLVINATGPDSGTYTLTTPNGTTSGPLVGITSLTFNALGGDDLLQINNPGGGLFAPSGGIFYNGGGQPGDALENLGGSATSGNYTVGPTNDAGTITHTNGSLTQTITFTGLAPATDTVSEATFSVTATDAANSITLDNGTATGDGLIRVSIDAFEPISFANKTNVVINGGQTSADSSDVITLANTEASAGLSTLTVNSGPAGGGSTAGDSILVRSTVAGVTTTVNGDGGIDLILVEGFDATINAILGPVNVNGNGGGAPGDVLRVNDEGLAAAGAGFTYTVTGTTVTRTTATITYATVERVQLDARNVTPPAGNTINMTSFAAGVSYTFNAGNGNDAVNISNTGTPAAINVNGEGGSDVLALANGASLGTGVFDGGSGTDTIDYGAYTTAASVNLGSNVSSLSANLDADQEVPPNGSTASGTAIITYNNVARTINVTLTVNGISPTDPGLRFHIHRAQTGVNGAIIVDLFNATPPSSLGTLTPTGPTSFTFTANNIPLAAMHEAALLGGITYFNVHTAAFPAGVIRGQLIPDALFVAAPGTATGTGGVTGVENAIGGAGADSIVGDNIANVLRGGGGNDVIVGARDNDTMQGDAGNDVLVWSNGDGSDIMDGGADADTVNVNGNPTADDVFTVGAGPAGRVDFDRISPAPFSLDIGTTESLIVNGVGGNDTFTVNSLAGITGLTAVNLFGFDGNDTFNVTPDANAVVNVTGHLPRSPATPGDTLNYMGSGTVNPSGPGSGAITQPGFQNVNFAGIENVNAVGGTFDVVIDANDDPAPGNQANDGVADNFRVVRNGANVQVFVNGALVFEGAYASVDTIAVNGSGDNDTLVVDETAGNPVPAGGIDFAGAGETGSPGDSLEVLGGAFNTVTYNFAPDSPDGGVFTPNGHNGNINLDGSVIRYTGLEPITTTGTSVISVFNLPDDGIDNQAILEDNGNLGDGRVRLRSGNNTFETVTFASPTFDTRINASDDGETLTLARLDSGYTAFVDYFGNTGNDRFVLDFSSGVNIVPTVGPNQVAFVAGGGTDSIGILSGYGATSVDYTFGRIAGVPVVDPQFGTISIDGRGVTYQGLEGPVTDGLASVNRSFTFDPGLTGNKVIALGDDPTPGNTVSRLTSNAGTPIVDFRDPTAVLTLNTGAGADVITFRALDAASPTPINTVINGEGGNDSLTVDFAFGNPTPGGGSLTFNGGAETSTPGDSLALVNINANTVTMTFLPDTTGHNGNVNLDGAQVNYTDLEPVTVSGTMANAVINLPTGDGNNQAILEDSPNPGQTRLRSQNGTFETTDFATPTASLTVNYGDDGESVTIAQLDPAFTAPITLNGGAGGDRLLVDFAGGTNVIPVGGITFNGAGGLDGFLLLPGYTATQITYTDANGNDTDGAVTVDGRTITYTGQDSAIGIFDQLVAANRTIQLNDADDTINLTDGFATGDGFTRFEAPGTALPIDFRNPTAVLTVNGGQGADVFNNPTFDAVGAPPVANLNGRTGPGGGPDFGDTFIVTPSTTTTFNVDGDLPTPPATPGDTLTVIIPPGSNPTVASTSTPNGFTGSFTFGAGGFQPVNFQEIETLTNTADLSITKTDNQLTDVPGTTITYTIVVTNNGPLGVTGATVTDTFPAELTGVTFTSTPTGGATATPGAGAGNINDTVNLPAGSTITYIVTATIASGATGTLTNTATVTPPPGLSDATPADNTASDQTVLVPSADLSVDKTDSPDPVVAGQNITYTLTITNNGPSDATNVTVTDAVPANTTFMAASVDPGSGGSVMLVGNTLVYTFPTLTAGQSVLATLTVNVNPDTPDATLISNTATVQANQADPNLANNSDTEFTTVTNQADLSVTKDDAPDPLFAGQNITYTITVTNAGPNTARDVTLTDVLPANTTFVSFTAPAGWTPTTPAPGMTGTVTATNPMFAVGNAVFTLVVRVNSDAAFNSTVTNTATVSEASAITNDPNLANNADTETTTVFTQADLMVTKTDTPDPVIAGQNITYTISATNNGPSDAQNVTVTDAVPPNTTFAGFVSISQGIAIFQGGLITASFGTIASGATATLGFVVTVAPGTPDGTVISNTATGVSSTADPNPTNNAGTATTMVINQADLSVTKTDSPDPVFAGQDITYTITVTNAGPNNAINASLTDLVPAGTTFVSFTAPAGWTPTTPAVGGTGNVTATNPSFAPGTAVFTLVVRVNPATPTGSTVTNTSTVTTTTVDPNAANNADTETTTVLASADLSVDKTGPATITAGTRVVETITVTNAGPSSAVNVVVTDVLPAGVMESGFAQASGPPATLAFNGSDTFTATIPVLAPGETAVFLVGIQVPANFSAGSTVTNTASIDSDTPDPVAANDTDTATSVVLTSADIQATKLDSLDPVIAGQNLTYTITVSNAGPSDAQNVQFFDGIPANTTFVSAMQTSGPTFTLITPLPGGTGLVSGSIATLAAGASATFTLVVNVNANTPNGATISNTVTAFSGTSDPNTGNNSATETTTVINQANLFVTKTDSPDPVIAGGLLTYTITVGNTGPNDAINTTLSDSIPANTTFVSAMQTSGPAFTLSTPPPGGTGTFTATAASFASGATATFTLVVRVNPNVPFGGNVTNTATVGSGTFDPNPFNNSDTETTAVNTQADLVVTKTDSPDPVIAGQTIDYTITLSNNGLSDAQNVQLTDVIPAGTSPIFFIQTSGPAASGVIFTGTSFVATFNTLAAGATATFLLRVQTDANAANGSTVSNTAFAISGTAEANPADNSDTETTTLLTRADLSVTKTDSPDPVSAGGLLTYTLTVSNTGPNAALNATLSDSIPANTTFVSAMQTSGPAFTLSTPPMGGTGTFTATAASFASGATATFTLVVRANASLPSGASISNTATVSTTTVDPNPFNNSDTETTAVITQADVQVTKTDSPDPVIAGTNLTYTITVSNTGPSDAQNVVLSDTVPANTTFVSFAQNSGPAFSPVVPPPGGSGTLSAFAPTLAAGASATFTFVVNVSASIPSGSTISNTASVSSSTTDATLANNSDTETSAVIAQADLSVTKADSPDPVIAGTNLTYTITVSNTGPSNAQSVVLSDLVPANTTFVSAMQTSGPAFTLMTPAGGTGTFTATATTLAAGASATFTFVVNVNANVSQGSTISNTATVSSSTADANSANNSDTETTGVITQADLSVTKTDSPDPVQIGSNLTYTITVSNLGASDAQNVVLSDTVPANTTFVSFTQNSGPAFTPVVPPPGGSGTLSAFISTLASGASATFTFVVNVSASTPANTTLSNTANITSTTTDPNAANNSDTETTLAVFTPITISGQKFNDLDGDGVKDAGEPGVGGVIINLDQGADGTVDASTTTLANGNYSFSNLGQGTYRIREVVPAGAVQTTANPPDVVAQSGVDVGGVDFGNFTLITISGQKFDDLDGDGTRDAGEPGVAGVTITLDRGADGTLDGTAITDASGNYSFTNLGPGTYRVREVTPAGRVQTTADPADVVASSGTNVSGVNFGNFALITISGQKFDDTDGDGVKDAGEPGRSGVTINLDIGANGSVDATTTTDSSGNYSFTNLGPGIYRVRELPPAGAIQTTANPADIVASSGTNVSGVDFGNFTLIDISGVKFNDADADGVRDAGEVGIQGVTINLDVGADGTIDATTATDANGNYSFTNLGPGTYRVREVVPAGFFQTTPNPADVVAASGMDVTGVNFGNSDTQVMIAASDPVAAETGINEPANPGQFTLTRTGNLSNPLTVTYAVSGAATNGVDYDTLSGTVTFAAGSATAVLNVSVNNDSLAEGSENVIVTLNPGPGFLVGPANTAAVDVLDNEPPVIVAAAGVPNMIAVGADASSNPHVRVFNAVTGELVHSFFAYGQGFTGGVRVALGDVNLDGIPDIITGAGPGAGPHVKVFDGQTGDEIFSFLAFGAGFSGGVFVAAGDVNGDNRADIIVGADAGSNPHVVVFSGANLSLLHSFFAYGEGFRGGVRVAAGDVDGDGRADIVTGSGPGATPHVRAFDGDNGVLLASFLAFDSNTAGAGTFVAAGDLDNDGLAELFASNGGSGQPQVRAFSAAGAQRSTFLAFEVDFDGGVRIGALDRDGNGVAELLVGAGPDESGPRVRLLDGPTQAELDSFFGFDPTVQGGLFEGGVFVAGR